MALIAHYKLDGNALDSVGGYHADQLSGVTWTNGKLGQCAEFDGSSHIGVTNFYNPNHSNPVFLGTSPSSRNNWNGNCSYSMWAYPTQLDSTARHVITDNNYNEGEIELRETNIRFSFSSGSTVIYETNVEENKWYHLAMTHEIDEPNNQYIFKAYVNGELVGQTSRTISGTSSNYGPDNRFVVGHQFIGKVDDVKIYDHVLSKKDIIKLSRAKILHYKFDAISNGLAYSFFTHDTTDFPTNTEELDKFFSEETTEFEVQYGGAGLWDRDINWGNNEQDGAGGIVDPKPSFLPDHMFAWKVEGYIYAPETGEYIIGCDGDDAIDVFVDGQLTANWYGGHGFGGQWEGTEHSSGENHVTGSISLTGGNYYKFVARMQERTGGNGFQVGWQKPSDSEISLIPKEYFFVNPPSVTDSSTEGKHATSILNTYPSYSSIVGLGSYEFLGEGNLTYIDSGSYLEEVNGLFCEENNEFSIGAWFKWVTNPEVRGTIDTNFAHSIVALSGGIWASATHNIYAAAENNYSGEGEQLEYGKLGISLRGAMSIASPIRVDDDEWHHIFFTWDGTTAKLYFDGQFFRVPIVGTASKQTYTFGIGNRNGSSPTSAFSFQGSITDVRIYGTSLSDSDIFDIYQERMSVDDNGSINILHFNENDF